ncbi:MAG: PAS domain-containing protein, partial [Candidatus Thorarchaeota archaeon]
MYEICRELAEIVDDGILIADSSLTVLLVNQKMADRLGRSQDELRGAPLSELMDRKQSEKLGKCLSTGSGGTIELSLRPGDERGTSSPIAATAVVSRDGLIVVRSRGFSGLLAGLNQSVLRVIEQWPEGIVLVNKDGTVIFANAVAESMLGFSRESDVGKDLTELLRTEPTARRKFRLVLEDATSGKKTTPLEVTVQVGEDLRHIEIRPIVFRTQDNRTVVAIDLRDVTSLRVAEEELRDRHAFDEAVMSCLFDGVLVTSNEGKVLYYNQSFAAMWGIPDRVLESRDDWKLIDHVLTKLKDPDAFKSRIRHLYGHSVVSKDILELTDGRVIERLSTPLVYSSRTVGRIWTFRDATATVRMAEGLLKSEEFLRG